MADALGKWKGRWPVEAYVGSAGDSDRVKTATPALLRFLDELATWNAKLDLTAAKTPEELCDLMLSDACALAKVVPDGASVVDIGSGAGGPGLSLALLRPDLIVTLVEPLAKRTAFLRTALATAGRTDVRVLRTRGEALLALPERWSFALSRATLAPGEWLALGSKLVTSGGSVAVLLAKDAAPIAPGMSVKTQVHYTLEHSGAERTLAIYRKD